MTIPASALQAAYDAATEDCYYAHYGIRIENKLRAVGDTCDRSKDNASRTDDRDFPEFGTTEYDDLPMLDGTCAWDARTIKYWARNWKRDAVLDIIDGQHVYLIAGDSTCDGGGDNDEVCICDAVVLAVIA